VSFRPLSLIGLLLVLLFGGACSQPAPPPSNNRVAVERFQSLSQDSTVKKLATVAADAFVWRHIDFASAAQDEEGLRQSAAGWILRGQVRPLGGDELLLEAQLINRQSGEWLERGEFRAKREEFLDKACAGLDGLLSARKIGAGQRTLEPAPCAPQANWLLYDESTENIEKLLDREPGFLPAYLWLSQRYAQGINRGDHQRLLAKLPDPQPGTRAGFLAGNLRLLGATSREQQLAGYALLMSVRTTDIRLWRDAAQIAQTAGQWEQAAQYWRELLAIEPGNPEEWNNLGYAEAQCGRTDAAVQAIHKYMELAPTEANPHDSLGEVLYMGRRFEDAARAFDELMQKHPDFQNRHGFFKAALAWSRAGNQELADNRYASWLEPLVNQFPGAELAFQQAYWLARTGRVDRAWEELERAKPRLDGEERLMLDVYRAILQFGLSKQPPPTSQFTAWAQQLKAQDNRTVLAVFGMLTDNAGGFMQWQERTVKALRGSPSLPLSGQIVQTGVTLWGKAPEKQAIEPLPETVPPTIFDAVLLGHRACLSGLACFGQPPAK
jgi:tetratricopeptide (TPR) repeat protein